MTRPDPLTAHKDPEWWKRCKRIYRPQLTDLCEDCGHTRDMHTSQGCHARSTSIVGDPRPCPCVYSSMGLAYRDAGTLERLEPA